MAVSVPAAITNMRPIKAFLMIFLACSSLSGLPALLMYCMPPFTKKNTKANEASTARVVTAGVTYARIAFDALVASARNASGKSTGIPMRLFSESACCYVSYDVADYKSSDNDCEADGRPDEGMLGLIQFFRITRTGDISEATNNKKGRGNQASKASGKFYDVSYKVLSLNDVTICGKCGRNQHKRSADSHNQRYHFKCSVFLHRVSLLFAW